MHKKYGWMESDHATLSLVVFQSQEKSSGGICAVLKKYN